MKMNKILLFVVLTCLIACAFVGIFEEGALNFSSKVLKNNLEFVSAVEAIQIIMSGLSSVNIPFISGHSSSLSSSLNKAENFLLITSVISYLQVILISVSKSWILKGVLVGLFGISFIPKLRKIALKFLIIGLALNPGLVLFTITVQEISKHASIDFGDKYLAELKPTVDAMRKEKSALMTEHARDLVRINNEEKGIVFFKRLKEDVSYDLKRDKIEIQGEYQKIRLFIKDSGSNVISKLVGFCSMVLFSMLLLPIGYFLIIKMLFRSLFNESFNFVELMNKLDNLKPSLIPSGVISGEHDVNPAIFNSTPETKSSDVVNESENATTVIEKPTTDAKLETPASTDSRMFTTVKDLFAPEHNVPEESVINEVPHLEYGQQLKNELDGVRAKITSHFSDTINSEHAKLHDLIQTELSSHFEKIVADFKKHLDAEKDDLLGSIGSLKAQYLIEMEVSKKHIETVIAQEKNQHLNEITALLKTSIAPATEAKLAEVKPKSVLTM